MLLKGKGGCGQKNRKGEGFIEERLDMFFGSAEWMVDFDKTVVQHILNQVSDHSMLMLYDNLQKQKMKSRFIFYTRWCSMRGCAKTVQNYWNIEVEGSRMFKFHNKLKYFRQGLLEWRKKRRTQILKFK